MRRRTLVTGFLEFGGFRVNPSALLAQSCNRQFELLEVSYAAVDQFLARLDSTGQSFDQLLMLGLRGDGKTIDCEQVARNHVGDTPDVRGVVRGPAPIEPGAPDWLRTTLFPPHAFDSQLSNSDDAGCYLCNYIYYRALRRFPGRRVGFVHVPPRETLPFDAQQASLARLLHTLEAA